jgi:protease IV
MTKTVLRSGAVALLIFSGCLYVRDVNLGGLPARASQTELAEVQIYPADLSPRSCLGANLSGADVLMIPIDGVIADEAGLFSSGGVSPGHIRRLLLVAEQNRNLKAILLHIDSPGGSAAASDHIYTMIRDFARERELPVYAHIRNIGASGGYYVAMAAQEINADPLSMVGSIGVIIRSFGVTGLMEKLGIEYRSIASGDSKDTLSPFAPITPEARKLLDEQIDRAYKRFLAVIQAGRGDRLPPATLSAVADGRVLDAETALNQKLIDSTGYLEDYIKKIERERGLVGMRVLVYMPANRAPLQPNVYNINEKDALSLPEKLMLLGQSAGYRVYYLWEAGL